MSEKEKTARQQTPLVLYPVSKGPCQSCPLHQGSGHRLHWYWAFSFLQVHVAIIAVHRAPVQSHFIFEYPTVLRYLEGLLHTCPQLRSPAPIWDLSGVLLWLMEPPFKPLSASRQLSCRHVSIESARPKLLGLDSCKSHFTGTRWC